MNAILVQSAFIYTSTIIIVTITNFLESDLASFADAVSLQLAGICFDLVLTRIWNDVASEQVHSLARSHRSELESQQFRRPQRRTSISFSSHTGPLDAEPAVAGASEQYGVLPQYNLNTQENSRGRLGVQAISSPRCVSMPDLNKPPHVL